MALALEQTALAAAHVSVSRYGRITLPTQSATVGQSGVL